MARVLDTQAFLDTVCDLLREGQTSVPIPVTGGSMIPFFHSGDTAYLDLLTREPRRGDIVLYTRNNGRYILHRIYKVNKNGSFVMVGDAQQELELLPNREQIHAIVTAGRHKGKLMTPKSLRWQLYKHVWLWLRPFRYRLMKLK